MLLQKKCCLITGASRGLGAALARLFWQEGASLFLCARNAAALAELAADLERLNPAGQQCYTDAGDLTPAHRPAEIVDRACSCLGCLDVLINNAAMQGPIGPLWENDPVEWERCLRLNLMTPAAFCAAVVLRMKAAGGGKIINLSGGGATTSRPNFTAYAASKTALVRLTETLAQETGDLKIDVNCVAPGVMPTRLLAEVAAAGAEKAGPREYAQAQAATGGEEAFERATRLCLWLASSASDGVTGKLLSARWDPWERLADHRQVLQTSDIYTLRRIVPADRGEKWGEVP